MAKQTVLIEPEQIELDHRAADNLKYVEIWNNNLDNTEFEEAEILFMGEFVCVYTSESCKERSANISDLLFRQTKKDALITSLRSQLNERSLSITLSTAKRIIDMGYRQIVQKE